MMSRNAFLEETASLRTALETRRKRYRRYHSIGIAAGALMLVVSLAFPLQVLSGIGSLAQVSKPVAPHDIAAFRFFAVLCAVSFSLAPVAGYRGGGGLSIERAVFARLLGGLGSFVPAAGGGISAADLRRTGCLAPLLHFHPGGGASGLAGTVRIRVCDASLSRRAPEKDVTVFKGQILLCELRVPSGEGASPRAGDSTPFEALMEEAGRQARREPPRHPAWDERLLFTAAALYGKVREAVLSRFGKAELPAERDYRMRHATRRPLRQARFPDEREAIVSLYSFTETTEASLALIASPHAVFTLGSLFAPALTDADAGRLYDLIQTALAQASRLAAGADSVT